LREKISQQPKEGVQQAEQAHRQTYRYSNHEQHGPKENRQQSQIEESPQRWLQTLFLDFKVGWKAAEVKIERAKQSADSSKQEQKDQRFSFRGHGYFAKLAEGVLHENPAGEQAGYP
jgi:hypothetical protein